MKIQADYMFVGASKYDFKSDSGEQMKGCKVHLIPLESARGDNKTGMEPVTLNADYAFFDEAYKLSPFQTFTFEIDVQVTAKGAKMRLLGCIGRATQPKPKESAA